MPEILIPAEKPVEAPDPQKMSDEYMSGLIVMSFRYSQGSQPLAARMLSAITKMHPELFPDGKFSESAVDEAVPIVQHISNRAHANYGDFRSDKQPVADNVAKTVVERQVAETQDYSEGSLETEIPTISAMIIQRDSNFLLNADPSMGRDKPGRRSNGRQQDRDTTFLSHYVYYGLAGNTAGPEEYNELFAAISNPDVIRALPDVTLERKMMVDGGVEIETTIEFSKDRFRRVLQTHFEHYPEDLDSVPEDKLAAVYEVIGPVALR